MILGNVLFGKSPGKCVTVFTIPKNSLYINPTKVFNFPRNPKFFSTFSLIFHNPLSAAKD